MTSLAERNQIITLVQEAMDSGARQDRACTVINFNARTLQRWQVDQSLGEFGVDTPIARLVGIGQRLVSCRKPMR